MFSQRAIELVIVLGFVSTGCVTDARQQLSAGPTGCAPERIVISEEERLAWVATCNGRRFRCSAGQVAVCSPEQPGNAPPLLASWRRSRVRLRRDASPPCRERLRFVGHIYRIGLKSIETDVQLFAPRSETCPSAEETEASADLTCSVVRHPFQTQPLIDRPRRQTFRAVVHHWDLGVDLLPRSFHPYGPTIDSFHLGWLS